MNKLLKMAAIFAATAALFAACDDDKNDNGSDVNGGSTDFAAPKIVLVDGDIDAPQEISQSKKVAISVEAPGGIKGFTIGIESPALTEKVLGDVGLATELDLVTPGEMAAALGNLGFPVGDKVKDAKTLTFDISQFIPMIAAIYDQTSDHLFHLTVTDNAGQSTKKTLTFHLSVQFEPTLKTTLAFNDDADLWKNEATVTVEYLPDGGKVEYRIKGADNWTEASLAEDGKPRATYTLAPVWKASKNGAALDIYEIEAGTGVFAGTTYEIRVVKEGETLATEEFTTAKGDAIPNSDMSGWSKKIWQSGGTDYPLTFPNAEGAAFWDSGNNMFLEQYDEQGGVIVFTPLCMEEEGTALLSARLVLGAVFAAGNMFTGTFDYAGMSGTVKFGQPYTWTARPRALKLRCKAKVGMNDSFGTNDPLKEDYKGKHDISTIFVAVVNWTAQHGVSSGMQAPTGMWTPSEAVSQAEGAILGYSELEITESSDGWVDLVLPLSWYDKAAANPSSAKISLVISCATSKRGDYLTGCSTNEMRVDDFEWVY